MCYGIRTTNWNVTETNIAATKSTNWWLDSEATIHVCNDNNLFKSYAKEKDGQTVLIENHDAVIVTGKGVVEINFTSGKKLILNNISMNPILEKNISCIC